METGIAHKELLKEIVLISFTPTNQEDAIVVKSNAAKRGLFSYTKFEMVKCNSHMISSDVDQGCDRPTVNFRQILFEK